MRTGKKNCRQASRTELTMKTHSASKFTITYNWKWFTQLITQRHFLVLGITLLISAITVADADNPLDPKGNITIQWDVMSWTPDGYVALVRLSNYQKFRHIQSPGWRLGWTWAEKEVIWSMVGAKVTERGDCSLFKGNIPLSCKKKPTTVDLMPGVPYTQQIRNCCKGGVISAYAQDPANSVGAFQLVVGVAGNSNTTVRLPKNFTLKAPGPGYTCGPAKRVISTRFPTADGLRYPQALMSWIVVCTYSAFLAHRAPTCCVSFSSYYNDTLVSCPACSCACRDNNNRPGTCTKRDSPYLKSLGTNTPTKNIAPILQCTSHMCPVKMHWHVELNYKKYWRVKLTITNFNYRMNYSDWNIVLQHPNFDNLTQISGFNYKPLITYGNLNGTALFWGIKHYNDVLIEAGPKGIVKGKLLLQKDKTTFTTKQGWAFPRRLYFNGEACVLPPYPSLPHSSLFKQ